MSMLCTYQALVLFWISRRLKMLPNGTRFLYVFCLNTRLLFEGIMLVGMSVFEMFDHCSCVLTAVNFQQTCGALVVSGIVSLSEKTPYGGGNYSGSVPSFNGSLVHFYELGNIGFPLRFILFQNFGMIGS